MNCFSECRFYELLVVAASVCCIKALAFLTVYGELSTAHMPEEFAAARVRLQQEWTFNAGFVSRFTIVFFFLSRR